MGCEIFFFLLGKGKNSKMCSDPTEVGSRGTAGRVEVPTYWETCPTPTLLRNARFVDPVGEKYSTAKDGRPTAVVETGASTPGLRAFLGPSVVEFGGLTGIAKRLGKVWADGQSIDHKVSARASL